MPKIAAAAATPRIVPPRSAAGPWTRLRAEFDAWAAEGRRAPLWWRDDDATRPGPRLEHLARTAGPVPLVLAVIPRDATADLATWVAERPRLTVAQHGWSHDNHAGMADKKIELGGTRTAEAIGADLTAGRTRLTAMFGSAPDLLVPPWNRIRGDVAARLPALGFTALSTYGDRQPPVPGLRHVNTHVDILDWRAGARFIGAERAIDLLVRRLSTLRGHASAENAGQDHAGQDHAGQVHGGKGDGRGGSVGACGVLTHHRVHDADTGTFLERLVAETVGHPGVRWLDGGTLVAEYGV